MFKDLIAALEALNLKPGESVDLKDLCQGAGLSLTTWAERFNSNSVSWMVREELDEAGFEAVGHIKGRRRRPYWDIVKR